LNNLVENLVNNELATIIQKSNLPYKLILCRALTTSVPTWLKILSMKYGFYKILLVILLLV